MENPQRSSYRALTPTIRERSRSPDPSMLTTEVLYVPTSRTAVVPQLSKRRKFYVMGISLTAVLFANTALGMMPLLIPIHIVDRQFSYFWTGMLFFVYGILICASELAYARILPVFGTKRTFVWCTASLGFSNIAFGCLGLTDDDLTFGITACFIRAFEAFSYAGVMNATLSLFCLTLPDKAGIGIGFVDGLVGLGYSLGPLIAALLFMASGFLLPYGVLGGLLILTSIWGHFGLVRVEGALGFPGFGFTKNLLKDLRFAAGVIGVLAMGVVVGYFEATLEMYLGQYGMGAIIEGLVIMLGWGSSAVISPLFGVIFKKWKQVHLYLIVGPFYAAFLFVFFGPFPGLEDLTNNFGLSVFTFVLICIGSSISMLASITVMLDRAEKLGMPDDLPTYAFIAAVWLATLDLGEALGGITSGSILGAYDYGAVTVSFVVCQLIFGIIIVALYLVDLRIRIRQKRHSRKSRTARTPRILSEGSKSESLIVTSLLSGNKYGSFTRENF